MVYFEVSAKTVCRVKSLQLRGVNSYKVNDQRAVDCSNLMEKTQLFTMNYLIFIIFETQKLSKMSKSENWKYVPTTQTALGI